MSTTALSDLPRHRLESDDDFNRRRSYPDQGCQRAKDIVVVVVVVVAVGALVLALVSLAKPGHLEVEYEQEFNGQSFPGGFPWSNDRVWTFAIGHYGINREYLDESSGTIKGYNVDIINAVCNIANKNCQLIYDDYERCWSSTAGNRPRGGEGLLGRWYDACTGWGINYDRSRTFAFTKSYSKTPGVGIYVANATTNFDWTNLSGRTIGFMNGFSSDEHCLARYADDLIQGSKLSASANQIIYYQTLEELVAAVINRDVDAAFCYGEPLLSQLKLVTPSSFPNRCALGGFGMMTRKDNTAFVTWWNDAFDKLVNTHQYRMICQDLKEAHGHIPGQNPDEICL
ncbi:arginine-binding periplasmic protein-like [Lytechinus variegatus]|uniref:arginine-binding periplasmic protein-like n=1 Tax=Lytechinus variegatus TaxID=7654 RepID=UPI001BB21D5A|nr:arginine-binding periplasmic protein-like [Lytechinus variegatus]